MIRKISALAVALAVTAPAVHAQVTQDTTRMRQGIQQQQDKPADQHGMNMQLAMAGIVTPSTILQLENVLDLTQEQVTQLEQLDQQYQQQVEPYFQRAMEAHQRATQTLETADTTQFQQYQTQFQQATEQMVQAHVAAAKLSVQARQILNEEQKEQLKTGFAIAHELFKGIMGGSSESQMGENNNSGIRR